MPVIVMTREMGTLGKDVAAGVAKRLGLELIHHELVERHLAERLRLGESAVHRFLEGESTLWERWKIDATRLSRFTAEEVLELAGKGNVLIRGWGAAQLLRDIPHVLCVRVCAPMPKRITEIKKRMGISDDAVAAREISRNDDAHGRMIQRQFNQDWQDPTGYDIVLNTEYVPVDIAIDIIERLAKSAACRETEQSRAALADRLVLARLRSVIETQSRSAAFASGLDIQFANGTVTLSGVIDAGIDLSDAIMAIHAVKGVERVEDKVFRVRAPNYSA